MIIGACGYGGTGSSAIKDFLKEFSNVQVLDRSECQYAFKVDGLQDLEYHLMKQYSRQMSGDYAIERFKKASRFANVPKVKKLYIDKKKYLKDTEDFLNSIIQAEYLGFDNADYENCTLIKSVLVLGLKKFIIPMYENRTGKLYKYWPMRKMHVSIKSENFYKNAKRYMMEILSNGGADLSKVIVLDQPFEGNNPTQSFPFFEDPLAIVVDRDPRDLYMAASYQWPDGTFMPRRNPEAFVQYYKRQRQNIRFADDGNKVLRLNLEEMIFDYENASKKVRQFIGFNESQHLYPKKYFNPARSIKGSQVYNKISGHDEEVDYISKALSEYLFDFDAYELSKNNTELNVGFKWDNKV